MLLTRIKSLLPKLTNYYKPVKQINAEKTYFLITSSGQMATFWLATQLNKHQDIFCTHSYDKPLWGADGKPLMGEEGRRQRHIIKNCFPKTLEQFFNEHTEATNKSLIGNAHAFNVDNALDRIRKENLANIKIVNLIRHPIARINSSVNCFKKEWFTEGYLDHLSFIPAMYHNHGRKIIKKLLPDMLNKFDANPELQFFIVSAINERGSLYHAKLAHINNIPNIRYEDITTSQESMKNLLSYLGKESLLDPTWLEQEVSYKKVNIHTKTSNDNIQNLYSNWEPWQKKIYDALIIHDKKFKFKFYSQHNYYDLLIN